MQVKCRNIAFRYPGAEKALFKELNLEFIRPGLHALFGTSGVGKSSLARIISGAVDAPAGVVADDAQPLLYAHNLERLPDWSAIGDQLSRVTPPHNRDKIERLLDLCGLNGHTGQRFSRLSLGQQNRINLVRYLVQDFQVLIFDECLANVDELRRRNILLHIKAMYPEKMFIYISHHVIEVATYCRDVWVLRDSSKLPQAVLTQGLDLFPDQQPASTRLHQVMLEIMNAA
ncbi:MAG: ATP-binding cassette domain-containing protein [Desulfatitalea sp.]|nr:ATP-binding cassette domain-containing protein [Desulfatitalea sp.]NNJ99508.1 ATP-binding cassette domain-containing protein [Desulfatitalea sp.]